MKLNNIYTIGVALSFLTACSSEETTPTYTVGEADNAIVLNAGFSEKAQTRAGSEDNHGNHLKLDEGIKLSLKVDGTWTGKTSLTLAHGSVTDSKVEQTTTATIGTETATNSKHNNVVFTTTEQLYWDDYGTADPANATTGRTEGLTIYGAAVNDKNVAAPSITSWTAQEWTVNADQTTGWTNKDFIISNNVKATGADGTYKFADRASGKLLEFRHAMSMITVKLTAGAGFVDGKFVKEPTVVLHGFPTSGKVNITDGSLSNAGTVTDVTTFRSKTTWASTGNVERSALVFPTRNISTIGTAEDDYIAKINADDNIYYVTKDKLLAAMGSATTMESGKNYILQITVNKTGIVVTATIVDWIDVEAEAETPLINVTGNVGDVTVDNNTKQRMESFGFYLSDAAGTSATTAYTKAATATKPTEGADGTTLWPFVDEDSNPTKLYWPNHQIHYFMRGVSPATTTVTSGKIAVTAGDYDNTSFPSNLLVGAPVIAENTMCGNTDHTQVDMSEKGICAREGKINLTFNYMMSQVEVHLASEAGTSHVNLENAKVEIVGGYTDGSVDIHTKTVATSGSVADFTLNHVGTENDDYRHSIVVPQNLTTNLKFKVTIYKSGSTTEVDDIYYATIKDIQVTENGTKKSITKWESGKHYVYTLNLKKTEINVTATITDWITVTASDNVWF